VRETGGALLVVSQFTLYGDCRKGRRPSFDAAAPAEAARDLYERFVEAARAMGVVVETGVFQAHMAVSLENDGPVTLPAKVTVADGIAVRCAGAVTFPLVKKYVDDIVTVDDEEIANAILLLLEKEKTLTEGAGAVATAAIVQRKVAYSGKKIGIVVSGGNIDVSLLSRIIERGLVKDGRLVRLRIHLPDHAGSLHHLSGVIAHHKANIVETMYDRAYHGVVLGDAVIDITMETRGPEHIVELTAALDAAGYTYERVL